jgi:hypothetical protein
VLHVAGRHTVDVHFDVMWSHTYTV